MKKSIRIISLTAAAVLTLGMVGCSDNPEDAYSSYWVTEESQIVTGGNNGTASNGNQSGGNNSSSGGTNSSSGGNNTSSGGLAGSDLSSKYKNLRGRTITVIGWWNATQAGTEDYQLILEVEKLFNCNFEEKKLTDYKPLYSSILAGQPMCDLFVPRDTRDIVLASRNMLQPLNQLSTFDADDPLWNPTVLAESSLNGNIYGMSADTAKRDILVYNKDLLDSLGYDLYGMSQNGKLTWDVLYEVMSKTAQVDAGGNVQRYGLAPKYDLGDLARFMINMNGVAIVSRSGDSKTLTNTLNTAAGTNALTQLRKWNSTPGYLYDCTQFGWASGLDLFKEGKAAMAITDENGAESLTSVDFTVGAVMFPHGPDTDKTRVTYEPSSVVMPVGVKDPEDVVLFWSVREAYNKQNRKTNIYDSLSDPSVKGTFDAMEDALWNKNYIYDYFNDVGLDTEIFRKVAAGSQTPQEAIQTVSQQISGKIADFWK